MTHARNWATRITHEASLHECNSFLTLTYSDEQLPDPPEVSVRHMQLFIKRLRFELEPKRVRYFLCGEYGGRTKRPHYHVILFGEDFAKDRYPWQTINGRLYYRSPTLERAWTLGHSTIGDVTHQSAGYVARYSVKKANDFAQTGGNPYMRVNAQTGEVYSVRPEFLNMSKKPGIGFGWLDKYPTDAFPSGFVVIDGKKTPIPPAYLRRIREHPEMFSDNTNSGADAYEQSRYEAALERADDNTPERRATREELNWLRSKQLKRDLE